MTTASEDVDAKKIKLSKKMNQALSYARNNGGSLRRYQGGYWSREQWILHEYPWFGTSTIEALVSRGLMSYSEWVNGRNGRFPVAAIVVKTPSRDAVGLTGG